MSKLHKLISHLDDSVYVSLEEELIRSKGENFLTLLRAYRQGEPDQASVREQLGISSNSLYVLKSRLYDKVQERLSAGNHATKEEAIKKLDEIPGMCTENHRQVANAFLLKLEKDFLHYEMHSELLVVYSALKKINLYSNSYFHYSQMYNRQVAYNLSVEKSEEILGSIILTLAEHALSRSSTLTEKLLFLRTRIEEHHRLNPSRHIEIIKLFVSIQLDLFCNLQHERYTAEELLNACGKLLSELPPSSPLRPWKTALDFLWFEYHYKAGHAAQSAEYYDLVQSKLGTLLLYTNVCLTARFLNSKLSYLQEKGRIAELAQEKVDILHDPDDVNSGIHVGLYRAMVSYHSNNYKQCAAMLNSVLNEHSLKDHFHIGVEIRLTLAYVYIKNKDHAAADNILKNLLRKLKSESEAAALYANALQMIKVLQEEVKSPGKPSQKQKDNFALFLARNKAPNDILSHLMFELKQRYSY
jgi:hypothetical protein